MMAAAAQPLMKEQSGQSANLPQLHRTTAESKKGPVPAPHALRYGVKDSSVPNDAPRLRDNGASAPRSSLTSSQRKTDVTTTAARTQYGAPEQKRHRTLKDAPKPSRLEAPSSLQEQSNVCAPSLPASERVDVTTKQNTAMPSRPPLPSKVVSGDLARNEIQQRTSRAGVDAEVPPHGRPRLRAVNSQANGMTAARSTGPVSTPLQSPTSQKIITEGSSEQIMPKEMPRSGAAGISSATTQGKRTPPVTRPFTRSQSSGVASDLVGIPQSNDTFDVKFPSASQTRATANRFDRQSQNLAQPLLGASVPQPTQNTTGRSNPRSNQLPISASQPVHHGQNPALLPSAGCSTTAHQPPWLPSAHQPSTGARPRGVARQAPLNDENSKQSTGDDSARRNPQVRRLNPTTQLGNDPQPSVQIPRHRTQPNTIRTSSSNGPGTPPSKVAPRIRQLDSIAPPSIRAQQPNQPQKPGLRSDNPESLPLNNMRPRNPQGGSMPLQKEPSSVPHTRYEARSSQPASNAVNQQRAVSSPVIAKQPIIDLGPPTQSNSSIPKRPLRNQQGPVPPHQPTRQKGRPLSGVGSRDVPPVPQRRPLVQQGPIPSRKTAEPKMMGGQANIGIAPNSQPPISQQKVPFPTRQPARQGGGSRGAMGNSVAPLRTLSRPLGSAMPSQPKTPFPKPELRIREPGKGIAPAMPMTARPQMNGLPGGRIRTRAGVVPPMIPPLRANAPLGTLSPHQRGSRGLSQQQYGGQLNGGQIHTSGLYRGLTPRNHDRSHFPKEHRGRGPHMSNIHDPKGTTHGDHPKGEHPRESQQAGGENATTDGPKEDGPKEGSPKEDSPQEDSPKEDVPKEDGPKEDGLKKDVPPEKAPQSEPPDIETKSTSGVPDPEQPGADPPQDPTDSEPKDATSKGPTSTDPNSTDANLNDPKDSKDRSDSTNENLQQTDDQKSGPSDPDYASQSQAQPNDDDRQHPRNGRSEADTDGQKDQSDHNTGKIAAGVAVGLAAGAAGAAVYGGKDLASSDAEDSNSMHDTDDGPGEALNSRRASPDSLNGEERFGEESEHPPSDDNAQSDTQDYTDDINDPIDDIDSISDQPDDNFEDRQANTKDEVDPEDSSPLSDYDGNGEYQDSASNVGDSEDDGIAGRQSLPYDHDNENREDLTEGTFNDNMSTGDAEPEDPFDGDVYPDSQEGNQSDVQDLNGYDESQGDAFNDSDQFDPFGQSEGDFGEGQEEFGLSEEQETGAGLYEADLQDELDSFAEEQSETTPYEDPYADQQDGSCDDQEMNSGEAIENYSDSGADQEEISNADDQEGTIDLEEVNSYSDNQEEASEVEQTESYGDNWEERSDEENQYDGNEQEYLSDGDAQLTDGDEQLTDGIEQGDFSDSDVQGDLSDGDRQEDPSDGSEQEDLSDGNEQEDLSDGDTQDGPDNQFSDEDGYDDDQVDDYEGEQVEDDFGDDQDYQADDYAGDDGYGGDEYGADDCGGDTSYEPDIDYQPMDGGDAGYQDG